MDNIQTAYVEETALPMVGEDSTTPEGPSTEDLLKNIPSELIDSFLRKRELSLSEEELNYLRYMETLSEDVYYNIGRLEHEKAQLLAKLNVFQNEKIQYLREVGIRHKVPTDCKWSVDLNEGKIEIADASR